MPDRRAVAGRQPLSARRAVLRVVRRLCQAGFQALLAGGCVRDMLLARTPKDYDVATDAAPPAVQALFPRTLAVGARFGVVMVLLGGRRIEVATFRSDQAYADGRRPQRVVFTDARHDALRRDFTINGMFYDPLARHVIDYVGGRRDLHARVVRAIGNPDDRFAEDHLRLVRAVRFAARLDFTLAPDTWRALQRHAALIRRVSPERVAAELEAILTDPRRRRGLELARDAGLLAQIFPTLGPADLNLGIETVARLPRRCSFPLALAALLVACDARHAGRLCRALRTSNDLRQQVQWLLESRPRLLAAAPLSKGRLKKWLAEPLFEPLVRLYRCWCRAAGQGEAPLRVLRRQIRQLGDEPVSPPRLLDGHDLLRLGAIPGPMVGQLAEDLYLAQLENQVQTRDQALAWVRAWLDRHRLRP